MKAEQCHYLKGELCDVPGETCALKRIYEGQKKLPVQDPAQPTNPNAWPNEQVKEQSLATLRANSANRGCVLMATFDTPNSQEA